MRGGARPGWLSLFPLLTLAVFLLPLAAGLVGTLLPAFGYLPALGGESLSLAPWRALFAAPGLREALLLSLGSGVGATLLALALTLGFAAAFQGSRLFARVQSLVAPLLAVVPLLTTCRCLRRARAAVPSACPDAGRERVASASGASSSDE